MSSPNNVLAIFALVISLINLTFFVTLNVRGILSWSGIGFITISIYVMGSIVSIIFWVASGAKWRDRKSLIIWLSMLVPVALMLMLPIKFYV